MSQTILDYISEELDVLDMFAELRGYKFLEEYDTYMSGSSTSSYASWTQTLLVETQTWGAKYNTDWEGEPEGSSSCNGGSFEFWGNEDNFRRWYKKHFPDEWEQMKDKLEDYE
jgi:hypothetical protein